MSSATWEIISKRESVYNNKRDPKQQSEQEIFELSVTAESEHRPGIVYRWRGRIEIDESGGQHLNTMFLDTDNSSESAGRGTAYPKIDIHKLITREDDPTAAFEKAARACDDGTQRIERSLVEREQKERQDREGVDATTLCLRQLAAEGIHSEAPAAGNRNGDDPHGRRNGDDPHGRRNDDAAEPRVR